MAVCTVLKENRHNLLFPFSYTFMYTELYCCSETENCLLADLALNFENVLNV